MFSLTEGVPADLTVWMTIRTGRAEDPDLPLPQRGQDTFGHSRAIFELGQLVQNHVGGEESPEALQHLVWQAVVATPFTLDRRGICGGNGSRSHIHQVDGMA